MRRVQDAPEVGEFVDVERVLGRHDRCGDLPYWHEPLQLPQQPTTRCQLERGHRGPHADVSLSGLVLATWPACDCGCEDGGACDYELGL
ncbi:hypothetical protein [Gordonia jacobaea]|uniref:hypothetical protein n=1 Tax=Gordonia jacobaea TaxID=122202 RepID=UPI002070094C|nr:hypothetical protein [Gordonia jacobaea]DAI83570.1 MAG TPA: hypothetical protein [Caudoviricetes sp.]